MMRAAPLGRRRDLHERCRPAPISRFASPSAFCYSRTLARVVPGSSAVEQPAVNRLVDGSNPSRGAKLNQGLRQESGQERKGKKDHLAT